jgi:predicted CXXCH cytochrome family protein
MYRWLVTFSCVAALLSFPVLVSAAGKHEGLNCTGCHGAHNAKGKLISAIDPNTKAVNPATQKPYDGITAFCLGCHETTENGGMGIMPVSASMSHPYGITPNTKVAAVPSIFLRSNKLDCVGCHDPHPSNPNYKYLRVDTKGGQDMQSFCSVCHFMKSGVAAKEIRVFNSMDERAAIPAEQQQQGKTEKEPGKKK